MEWVKKNVVLLVSAVVAVLLMGLSGFFLVTKIKAKNASMGEFEGAVSSYGSLISKRVSPVEVNVGLTRDEAERVVKVEESARSHFGEFEVPENLDWLTFKAFLENTLYSLKSDAKASGVRLPIDDYAFTFSAQRQVVEFAAGTLEPLSYQVAEIKALMDIVFGAKVHSVEGLRRGARTEEDQLGSRDILPTEFSTNSVINAIYSPYEVSVNCFSGELGGLLAGFANSDQVWIVKAVTVQKAGAASPMMSFGDDPMAMIQAMNARGMGEEAAARASMAAEASRYGITADVGMSQAYGGGGAMADRYGGAMASANPYGGASAGPNPYGGQYGGQYGGRDPYGRSPVGIPAPRPRNRGGLETVLNEEPLRVTIRLNAVRLLKDPSAEGADSSADPYGAGADPYGTSGF